jgi:DNA-binding transcriptional ArsR family regulator
LKTKEEISSVELDKLFSSLGDSTRRQILTKVRSNPCNVLKLAAEFNMSLPAVSKHIKILSEAGLITKKKEGRFIYCSYNHNTMKPAMDWISQQHNLWDKSFDRLANYMKDKSKKK